MNFYINNITSQNNTEYWFWFTMILFLLFPIDTLSTFLSIKKYGLQYEANPLIKLLLSYNITLFILFNLFILLIVVYLFSVIINNIDHIITYLFIELFLSVLLFLSIFIVINNILIYLYNITPLQVIFYII